MGSRVLLVRMVNPDRLVFKDCRDHKGLRDLWEEIEGMEQMAHQGKMAFRGLQALLEQRDNQVQMAQLGFQDLQDHQVLYPMM